MPRQKRKEEQDSMEGIEIEQTQSQEPQEELQLEPENDEEAKIFDDVEQEIQPVKTSKRGRKRVVKNLDVKLSNVISYYEQGYSTDDIVGMLSVWIDDESEIQYIMEIAQAELEKPKAVDEIISGFSNRLQMAENNISYLMDKVDSLEQMLNRMGRAISTLV